MTIECKWELPDMTAADDPMSYAAPYDDTPATLADGPICEPGVPAVNGRRHMMGVLPNEDDDPIQRRYEKWVAVQSANIGDIIDVYWKVWEPYVALPPNGPNCTTPVTLDGAPFCFKYQHHATADLGPPTSSNPLGSGNTMFSKALGNCAALQAMTDMFTAANQTGQMSVAEAAQIVDKCFQGEKAVFRVKELISKEQPYGEYRVEATIVNSAGATFQNVNYFDVVPFIFINKDFTAVDWQTVQNNGTTIISGDTNMQPAGVAYADGSGVEPTIENTGNQEMFVSVHFSPLILDSDPTKQIIRFDASFRAAWQTDPGTLQTVDPLYASNWFCFNQHPLGSNDPGKLDLSVHPENAQQGHYTGAVNVLGWGGSCPP
jgi:hypothetical protein